MVKKRGNSEFLINFNETSIKPFIKGMNKEIKRSTKGINKSLDSIRKIFTRYEEPFCEIRQNHKGMKISIKLPDVKKKDITLNITSNMIEIKASTVLYEDEKRILKNYYRIINIPQCSQSKKTKAEYKKDKLEIKVPYTNLKKEIVVS